MTSRSSGNLRRCAIGWGDNTLFKFCIVALLSLPGAAGADEPSLPPGTRPVQVAVGFFLANLSGVAERSETFDADLYLSVRWHDARLAFAGTEPKRFLRMPP